MRKTIITITVIALIASILSTGLLIFLDSGAQQQSSVTTTISAE